MTMLDNFIKQCRWHDIALIKLAAFAFALMLAKLWEPLLSLEWYWYLVIVIVAGIIPGWKLCCVKSK